MTYGWTILILAVVLGSLYFLGVFNSTHAQPNACLAISGYVCTGPVLYASGQLSANIGQVGQTITVTNTYCTSTPVAPSGATGGALDVPIYSDQNATLQFQCPITSGATGAAFSGYLWIVYNTQSETNLIEEVGAIKASVIKGGSGPNTALGYVAVTLTNSQSSTTGSDFQDMITVDSAAYGNYINSGWENVEFTTGAPFNSGGTPIYAWVESNPSNTASSTVVWIKLPDGIAASSTANVYMNFMTNNVMTSGSSYTGEAPQISPSYAEYDNGASEFSFYQNFAGTTTPSGWTSTGSTCIVQDNGIAIGNSANSCIFQDIMTTSASYGLDPTQILDVYVDSYSTLGPSYGLMGVGYTNLYGPAYGPCNAEFAGFDLDFGNEEYSTATGCGQYPIGNSFTTPFVATVYWPSTASVTFYTNYNYIGSLSIDIPATQQSIGLAGNTGAGTITVQWIRQRAYPPGGFMPSYSFGSIVT